ncbi:MAG TPA: hypothetical protein VGP07_25065 [Polyangia bacterium]|jgi:alpha-L-arabinofuranosidase
MFPVVSAGTTVDDQRFINISLANVYLTNSRRVAITIKSGKTSYVVSSAQVITGPATATNDYGQAEKVYIQALPSSSCSASGRSLQVTLLSKSVPCWS